MRACFCIGPQGDDPVCPCRMRRVRRRGGRYIEERDLGPVRDDFNHIAPYPGESKRPLKDRIRFNG